MVSDTPSILAEVIGGLVVLVAIAGTATAPFLVMWRQPSWRRLLIAMPVFLGPAAIVAASLVGWNSSTPTIAIIGLEVIWSVIGIGLAKGLRGLALWFGLVGTCTSLLVRPGEVYSCGTPL